MRNGVLVRSTSSTVTPTTPTGLAALLGTPRYEILPTVAAEAAVVANVPTDVTISVTASPTKGLEPTLDVVTRLAYAGYHAVPHLSARLIAGDEHLAEIVVRLRTAGVTEVFVPAGDADPPAGEFLAALDVLTRLTAMGSPFEQVGITGYPETHPLISDDVTIQAMWEKRTHATYIVSNICFDPAVVARWMARLRSRGIEMPVRLGVTGPVERTKLLAMATKIGVGESTRFLGKHPGMLKRFAGPNGFSPERYLRRTVSALERQGTPAAGLHIYTFNQVAETERWRRQMLTSTSR